jgi:hypothetical protein
MTGAAARRWRHDGHKKRRHVLKRENDRNDGNNRVKSQIEIMRFEEVEGTNCAARKHKEAHLLQFDKAFSCYT